MSHETTQIYSQALELVALSARVIHEMPNGFGFLVDQLRRAASSVPLFFAEGCAHTSLKERARYFTMARGSAKEVAAIFDVAHQFGVIDAELRARGKDRCDQIGAMLYRFP